ncbi:MAG: hypothetical protein SPL53_09530 [Bacteroidales bacterium]|nr:hypothetical protein [Bacteroidales bacterium]
MTNYYDTLGLPDYESSQEAIKQAYKRGTQRLSEAATAPRDDAEAATLPHSLHNHK